MLKPLNYSNGAIFILNSISEVPLKHFPTRLDWLIVVVCKKGEVSATIDISPRRMGPSSIMVLRPGHLIRNCQESSDFEGFYIVVHEDKIAELLPSLHYIIPYSIRYNLSPIIEISEEELHSQYLIYEMLQRQSKFENRIFNKFTIGALCEVLFYNTLSIFASRSNTNARPTRREELLSDFVDLLEKNFRQERSVNYYANNLYVTPKHLSSVLKEMSGKTAGEWIDHRVIIEAKLLLRTTGMNIQEISQTLNFANQSFFGKYFKHLTGISPREFRNNLTET